jgi:hypothetical protein
MNDMNNFDVPPAFINVLVIVTPNADGNGNADDGLYTVTTIPTLVKVTRPNTIINYQLIPPTPTAMQFAGMKHEPSNGVPQLSSSTISLDGQMLTVIDLNSDPEEVAVTLLINTGGGNIMHDPQIQNTPEG